MVIFSWAFSSLGWMQPIPATFLPMSTSLILWSSWWLSAEFPQIFHVELWRSGLVTAEQDKQCFNFDLASAGQTGCSHIPSICWLYSSCWFACRFMFSWNVEQVHVHQDVQGFFHRAVHCISWTQLVVLCELFWMQKFMFIFVQPYTNLPVPICQLVDMFVWWLFFLADFFPFWCHPQAWWGCSHSCHPDHS